MQNKSFKNMLRQKWPLGRIFGVLTPLAATASIVIGYNIRDIGMGILLIFLLWLTVEVLALVASIYMLSNYYQRSSLVLGLFAVPITWMFFAGIVVAYIESVSYSASVPDWVNHAIFYAPFLLAIVYARDLNKIHK